MAIDNNLPPLSRQFVSHFGEMGMHEGINFTRIGTRLAQHGQQCADRKKPNVDRRSPFRKHSSL